MVGENYVLRPGDIISITLLGDPPVTTPDNGLRIPLDGRISFYNVQGLQAAGLTREQLENALTEGVKRYIRNPEITVNLLGTPNNQIAINGAVKQTGDHPYRSGLTFFDVLSQAGGVLNNASKTALIYRKDAQGKPQFLKVDLIKLFEGDISQDLPVFPGDRIIINESTVNILGMVQSPGVLPLRAADTVGKAIAATGGTLGGADLQNAFIRRGETTIPINLRSITESGQSSSGQSLPLQAGDTLTVPALTSKVIVIGDTANTGPVLLTPRISDKALDVLAQAGVSPRTSDLNNVLLIRNFNGNNEVRTELNLGPKGPQGDNVILQNGDVLYVQAKKDKDSNQALLNAALIAQLLGALRSF